MPKAEEKVSVIVPSPPGEPVPVVAIMIPAVSVEPVSSAQDGEVPPPLVKVQVGAAPLTVTRLTVSKLVTVGDVV